jgi:thiosulfate reductase/polysulfide reductase chain A
MEITGFSDVVLPESTYLERADDLWAARHREPFVALRQPAVAPMYDSKPGWWIARELGKRLGLGDFFPWKDVDDYLATRARSGGYEIRKLREQGVIAGKHLPVCEEEGLEIRIATDSGKIELFSKTLAGLGKAPLPEFVPPDEPPPGQFRLLSGRSPLHTFGRTANNRLLGEIVRDNELWINEDAAATLGGFEARPLTDGELVVLVNQEGKRSQPLRAKLTQRIRGDAVYLVHGFGHDANGLHFARGRGASHSELVSRTVTDPVMGGTALNVSFVSIERAGRTA